MEESLTNPCHLRIYAVMRQWLVHSALLSPTGFGFIFKGLGKPEFETRSANGNLLQLFTAVEAFAKILTGQYTKECLENTKRWNKQ